ncbi:hypothetical protein JTE90_006440 [Oedothorax gibbosus]|uniref:Uncharacterized protein n=1 Tax=Oedothorax gibbosus TaxID=931172 RepID=A0AAV6TPK9_9ARAC|nr:hypothetical protein JTE90_006440 [Oedothorax gibbosus]
MIKPRICDHQKVVGLPLFAQVPKRKTEMETVRGYRQLNNVTKPDRYPTLTHDVAQQLEGKKNLFQRSTFSVPTIKFQEEEDIQKTVLSYTLVFWFPFMNFGFCNALKRSKGSLH